MSKSRRGCSANIPFGEVASHVIGYIGASVREKERIEAAGLTANYKGSDYIGKVGIELSYEKNCTARPAPPKSRWMPRGAWFARCRANLD